MIEGIYPVEEIKADWSKKPSPWHTEEPVRMTKRQLAEWLARGFGQYTFGHDDIYTFYTIDAKRENKCVDDAIRIRYWGSDGWIVPTLEIYERDCNGN